MGSLVGGLYASAPGVDPVARYQAFMQTYVEATKRESSSGGLLGALLVGGLILASGGTALAVLGGAAVGGLLGMSSVDPVELQRLSQVYDRFVGGATIETLPVPYATFYIDVKTGSPSLAAVTEGKLAAGVKKSIANPVIFDEINPVHAGYVDPGLDRIAAVPVRDTCEQFPRHQILAVNVTGKPAELDGVKCPVRVVEIPPPQLSKREIPATLMGKGQRFEQLVATGYRETIRALEQPRRARR